MSNSKQTTLNGNLIITKEDKTDYSELIEVSGSIYVRQGATLHAPALTKSGYIEVQKGATLHAPEIAERLYKIGYVIIKNYNDPIPFGIYLNITTKEIGYLKMMKPLIANKRLDMNDWHSNFDWKNQAIEEVLAPECGTTHCMAGWIQIFEKDKYNDMTAEEAGKTAAPNLACLFYSDNERVELAINTLFPDQIC